MVLSRAENIAADKDTPETDASPESAVISISTEKSSTERKEHNDRAVQMNELPSEEIITSGLQSDNFPPMDEFREKILKALRQERHSLAAAMDKSGSWTLEGNSLNLSFNSPFESTFIEKESREIETIIKKALGWNLHIITIVKHKQEEHLNQDVEEQVELVRNIFRGTLINRS